MIRQIDGRHVLFGMIAFFGVIFAANIVFVILATDTFTGLWTDDPYRKGLHYNETIEAYHAQQAAGWSYDVELAGDALQGRGVDRNDKPVDALTLEGRIGRPTTDAFDREVRFAWQGPGLYTAAMPGLAPGQWDVSLSVQRTDADQQSPYKVTARLWVKQ